MAKTKTRPVQAPLERPALYLLLAAAVGVMAPHVSHLPPWLTALGACLIALRFFIAQRGGGLPNRWLLYGLTLLITVSIYKHYNTVLGRDAGMAMLVGMLCLKFLEVRAQRDAMLCVFMLYFLILGSFLYSQSLWLGVYMLAATVLCTASLIRINQPEVPGLPFPMGLAGALLLKALPLTLLLFFFFPRIHGALWALPSDAYAGRTGLSDEMRPGSINQLSESEEIAFRVDFTSPPPPSSEMYWRSLVLWTSDGQTWSKGPSLPPSAEFDMLTVPVAYSITLEPTNKTWLVALDLPRAQAPTATYFSAGYVLESTTPVQQRLRYSLLSAPRYRTHGLTLHEQRMALQTPPVSQRVQDLARSWQAQASRPEEIATAALTYFRQENFYYTLRPPLLGNDPVDAFLFTTRRGFCEHYAGAFVTLMRSAGVPSRVVVGYQGGTRNPTGDYWIVRQSDAHAWAEIWSAENGWQRVDPTAAVAPERIEYGADALRRLVGQGAPLGLLSSQVVQQAIRLGWFSHLGKQTRLMWDAINYSWYRWVQGYSQERQRDFLKRLGMADLSWLWICMGVATLVALLLWVYALVLQRAPKPDPVKQLYEKFCRRMLRLGLQRAPQEGAMDFAQRSRQQRPDLGAQIEAITQLYVRLRYGQTAIDKTVLTAFKNCVAAFRPTTK